MYKITWAFIFLLVIGSFFVIYSIEKSDSESDISEENQEDELNIPSDINEGDNDEINSISDIEENNSQGEKETSLVTLSIEKEADKISFTAKTQGEIFVGNIDYFHETASPKTGTWRIYKYENEKWEEIKISTTACNFSCDLGCESNFGCNAWGGPSPKCKLASQEQIFEWDKKSLNYKEQVCDEGNFQCTYYDNIKPGNYKITFTYQEDCEDEKYFYHTTPITIEEEFSI